MFTKGGPPGPGRPKGSKLGSSLPKEWADRYGFAFLIKVAEGKHLFETRKIDKNGNETVTRRSPELSERCAVATYLIDRAYGKPSAALSVDIQARLSLEQIVAGSREPIDVEPVREPLPAPSQDNPSAPPS